jgi:hypothetical protein
LPDLRFVNADRGQHLLAIGTLEGRVESEHSRGNERWVRETGAPASMSASLTNACGSQSSPLPHRLPTRAFDKTMAIGAGAFATNG